MFDVKSGHEVSPVAVRLGEIGAERPPVWSDVLDPSARLQGSLRLTTSMSAGQRLGFRSVGFLPEPASGSPGADWRRRSARVDSADPRRRGCEGGPFSGISLSRRQDPVPSGALRIEFQRVWLKRLEDLLPPWPAWRHRVRGTSTQHQWLEPDCQSASPGLRADGH